MSYNNKRDPIVGATLAIAVATAVMAVIAFLQWRTLSETNRLSQAEIRPKLMLVNRNANPEIVPAESERSKDGLWRVSWTWEFTNFGQGMAKEVSIADFIKIEDGPFQPSFGRRETGPGGDIPPAAVSFATTSSEPMIASYATELLTLDFGVSFLIIFDYKDEPGNTYTTEICLSRSENGAMHYLNPAECKNQIATRPE